VFSFLNTIPASSTGYTVFVYAEPLAPLSGDGAQAFIGSAENGFEYRTYQGKQGDLTQNVGGGGSGANSYPSGFSLFDVTASPSGGGFRLTVPRMDLTEPLLSLPESIRLVPTKPARW
jgi:hypothetical protein